MENKTRMDLICYMAQIFLRCQEITLKFLDASY